MQNQKFDSIKDAIADLKDGKIVILCDDENRENEGDFIALAQTITPQTINFMITNGRGLVCMPIAQEYANHLKLTSMVDVNTCNYQTAFTVSIDHVSNSTGISAYDRATTIQKVLDENSVANDFRRPGHIFPLIAKPLGVLERAGHTEAVVDLAKLCGSKPAGVLCEIINTDGTMARYPDLLEVAKKHNLKRITIKDLVDFRKCNEQLIAREVEAELPTKIGKFNIIGYSSILDNKEHIAIVKNINNPTKPPLVRLHSECLTGDSLYSLRCDCGEQLEKSLAAIEEYGTGVLLYLRQEGRGIGLFNKLKAYKLQDSGLDTVDANLELGLEIDARDYLIAAQILHELNITKIRLITNNPKKVAALEKYHIKVLERVYIKSTVCSENEAYLNIKASKLGHLL